MRNSFSSQQNLLQFLSPAASQRLGSGNVPDDLTPALTADGLQFSAGFWVWVLQPLSSIRRNSEGFLIRNLDLKVLMEGPVKPKLQLPSRYLIKSIGSSPRCRSPVPGAVKQLQLRAASRLHWRIVHCFNIRFILSPPNIPRETSAQYVPYSAS